MGNTEGLLCCYRARRRKLDSKFEVRGLRVVELWLCLEVVVFLCRGRALGASGAIYKMVEIKTGE